MDDDDACIKFSGNIQSDGFALWCVCSKLGCSSSKQDPLVINRLRVLILSSNKNL